MVGKRAAAKRGDRLPNGRAAPLRTLAFDPLEEPREIGRLRKLRRLMVDQASDQVSRRMKRVRRTGTTPELRIRKLLRGLGLAFRTNVAHLPGTPDAANVRRRWAVFVHGCFWHAHSCARGTSPKANHEFWTDKFRKNKARDRRNLRALRGNGFDVLVVWECEFRNPERLRRRLEQFSERVLAEKTVALTKRIL